MYNAYMHRTKYTTLQPRDNESVVGMGKRKLKGKTVIHKKQKRKKEQLFQRKGKDQKRS